jgi:hypothetical protein
LSKIEFTSLPAGFTPRVVPMGYLLPKWLQEAIDGTWQGDGYNGAVYAADVSGDWKDVFLWKTSFAVRAVRGKELEFNINELQASHEKIETDIKILNIGWSYTASINIEAKIVGSTLKIKIFFKTVNITSIGLRKQDRQSGRKAYVLAGDHRRAGAFPFGGILDVPDLFEHAKREIREESGLAPNNLQIIGVVPDENSINFVGVYDIPTRSKCRRLFQLRKDQDREMRDLVFIPEDEIDETLSRYSKQWAYLLPAVKRALRK